MCPGDKAGGAEKCKVAVITGNTNCHTVECVFVFWFLIHYVSNREGAAKVGSLTELLLLLFETLLYLMRCLTAEIDLLSYFMSCF